MSAPSDRISVFHLNDGFIQPMLNFRLWRASCPSASTSLPPKPALRSIPASRRFETERPSGACADRPSLKFSARHGIADYDTATVDDPGGDAAVPAHRVITPDAQVLLHARAWMTFAGGLQQGFADPEPAIL